MSLAYVLLGASQLSLKKLSRELFSGRKDEPVIFQFPGNPIDSLEQLPKELSKQNLELAKVISLSDMPMLESHPKLIPWFEMLIHFSDILLLEGSKNVSPAWLSNLKKKLKAIPLGVYEWPVSGPGIVDEIIYPEARRLSQYFEETVSIDVALVSEEGGLAEEDDPLPEEKYFARDAAGRRVLKIMPPP